MPELPEVESLRLYLAGEDLIGGTISEVQTDWPPNRSDDYDLSELSGRRIERFGRIGKNLFVYLDRGVLWMHMGMTGRLAVMHPAEEPMRYARMTLFLDDERRIELDDPRRWAGARLEESDVSIRAGLGPDALESELTPEEFVARVKGKRSPIKSVLMDQSVIAGVGNIYADEALHRSGINPSRRADRISVARLKNLHSDLRTVLMQALRYIVDHPDERGRPYVVDAYDDRMRLYRKKGSTCPDCGGELQTRKFGGRTAYYCLLCQS